MPDVPQFKSLADFVAYMADPAQNGTGLPRTHFTMHVDAEPTHPGSAETINVLKIHPHGFDHMVQRFALHAEEGNMLLNHEQIAAFKTFKQNEATARQEAAQDAQQRSAQKASSGVVSARLGDAGGAQ